MITIKDDDSKKQAFLTQEGLTKLQDELDQLKTVERRKVASRLKEAISYGDLSENAEYEEAKNEQAFVEGRILELDEKIKNAKVVKSKKANIVQIGSTVVIKNITDGDDPEEYVIVGSAESDPLAHKISNESPIGNAVIDKEEGAVVEVEVPAGLVKYEVIKIS
ncbi:transcription elongation factor GreA [Patescibacteria group bacterium]|nr:transcription elongation factor GreA [Patescibacteria group bacterium]